MKLFKIVLAVGIVLGVFFTLTRGGSEKEKAYQACMGIYSSPPGDMVADIVSPAPYCACVAETTAKIKRVQYSDIQPCIEAHIRPALINTCSAATNAHLRRDAGLEMDCACVYDRIARLTWQFYSGQVGRKTTGDKEQIGRAVLKECARQVSPG